MLLFLILLRALDVALLLVVAVSLTLAVGALEVAVWAWADAVVSAIRHPRR